jgi:hypothetical protein
MKGERVLVMEKLLEGWAWRTCGVDTNLPGRNVRQLTLPGEFLFGWAAAVGED